MALTKEQRNALPDSDFAVPGKRALPMHDARHVRLAWDMVSKTKELSDEERSEARRRILRKAQSLGVDTSKWDSTLHAEADQLVVDFMAFEAMALDIPEVPGHPNRVPFTGVLTHVDQPSDYAPHGSGGKRVLIPRAVAEKAIPSLLGMAIDFNTSFNGHDQKRKIGIITSASVEGNDIPIGGFFYGADFPEEVAFIQKHKDDLGFSYETQHTLIADRNADPLTVESLVFTGAAVLLKNDAAYTTTSLNANAEEVEMNEELQKALDAITESLKLQAAAVASLEKKVEEAGKLSAGSVHGMVKPHADRIRAAADSMCASGMGMHEKAGHVTVLRGMADKMEADAHLGKLPHIFSSDHFYASAEVRELVPGKTLVDPETTKQLTELKASNEKLQGEMTALIAAAGKKSVDEPGRKSFPPAVTALLQRAGVTMEAGKERTFSISEVDEFLDKAGIRGTQERMAAKLNLREAKLLAA